MENEEKPNYYGLLPATVRYNKDIRASAKLLYAELTALTNKYGYCMASNEYFAKLYEVSTVSISHWFKQLEQNGFIEIEYIRNGSIISERRVFICEPLKKSLTAVKEKFNGTVKKKFKDNNTSINNNINNNIKEIINYHNNLKLELINKNKIQDIKEDYSIITKLIKNILKENSVEEIKEIINYSYFNNFIINNNFQLKMILSKKVFALLKEKKEKDIAPEKEKKEIEIKKCKKCGAILNINGLCINCDFDEILGAIK